MKLFGKEHGGANYSFRIFLSNSFGVAILIRPNMSFDLRFLKHIVKGRCIHLCIAIKYVVYDIVNVYAPSGDGAERSNFYTTVRKYVLQNIGQNVTVMAGDFNCTLNPKYDRASQVESHKHSANLLRDLVKELCITDCYRYMYPTTWHNIRSFARLDRIYVSTFLKSHIQCSLLLIHHVRFQIMTVLMQSFVCQVQVERKAIGSSMCPF